MGQWEIFLSPYRQAVDELKIKLKGMRSQFGIMSANSPIEFVSKNYYNLDFSPSVDVAVRLDVMNPKRKHREARKQSQVSGIGTKSQQALQLQREENKLERKIISREIKEAEKQRQFELKQQKRKEKHRGK